MLIFLITIFYDLYPLIIIFQKYFFYISLCNVCLENLSTLYKYFSQFLYFFHSCYFGFGFCVSETNHVSVLLTNFWFVTVEIIYLITLRSVLLHKTFCVFCVSFISMLLLYIYMLFNNSVLLYNQTIGSNSTHTHLDHQKFLKYVGICIFVCRVLCIVYIYICVSVCRINV